MSRPDCHDNNATSAKTRETEEALVTPLADLEFFPPIGGPLDSHVPQVLSLLETNEHSGGNRSSMIDSVQPPLRSHGQRPPIGDFTFRTSQMNLNFFPSLDMKHVSSYTRRSLEPESPIFVPDTRVIKTNGVLSVVSGLVPSLLPEHQSGGLGLSELTPKGSSELTHSTTVVPNDSRVASNELKNALNTKNFPPNDTSMSAYARDEQCIAPKRGDRLHFSSMAPQRSPAMNIIMPKPNKDSFASSEHHPSAALVVAEERPTLIQAVDIENFVDMSSATDEVAARHESPSARDREVMPTALTLTGRNESLERNDEESGVRSDACQSVCEGDTDKHVEKDVQKHSTARIDISLLSASMRFPFGRVQNIDKRDSDTLLSALTSPQDSDAVRSAASVSSTTNSEPSHGDEAAEKYAYGTEHSSGPSGTAPSVSVSSFPALEAQNIDKQTSVTFLPDAAPLSRLNMVQDVALDFNVSGSESSNADEVVEKLTPGQTNSGLCALVVPSSVPLNGSLSPRSEAQSNDKRSSRSPFIEMARCSVSTLAKSSLDPSRDACENNADVSTRIGDQRYGNPSENISPAEQSTAEQISRPLLAKMKPLSLPNSARSCASCSSASSTGTSEPDSSTNESEYASSADDSENSEASEQCISDECTHTEVFDDFLCTCY